MDAEVTVVMVVVGGNAGRADELVILTEVVVVDWV